MSSRFTRWFRGLSSGQAFVVYGFLVVFVLLTLWHNPMEGYYRTLTAIKAQSADEAIYNMKIRPDLNDWEHYDWWWKQRRIQSERPDLDEAFGLVTPKDTTPNRYFYMDKNPWWWVYAYESKGFDEDAIPRFVRAPLNNLETLGGYLQTVVIVAISASVLIWLMGLRKFHAETKEA